MLNPSHHRRANSARAGLRAVLAALAALATTGVAHAEWGLNMTRGVTRVSHDVYSLHMLIFWICVAIAVAVFGVMIYSIVNHRKSKGVKPADFHDSIAVEIAWTVVPFLILVAMAVPSAKTLIEMEDFRGSEITIKVTGYQWKWHYEYLEQGVSFYSTLDREHNVARQVGSGVDVHQYPNYLLDVDQPLVVPTGKKVRLLLTANDVIHSWWVPALGGKKDAIPGYVQEFWFQVDEDKPGVYRGQCAELCGRDHGFMPIVVNALAPAEYDAWLAARKPAVVAVSTEPKVYTKDELLAAGEKHYGAYCAACHMPDGTGNVAMNVKALKGSPVAKGPIADHFAMVLKGSPKNPLMASWKQLSDDELAAIITYERNAWGNATGDVVQPADVAAARK